MQSLLATRELLEREAELATIKAVLDGVPAGGGRLLVVQAGAGMGRTRLLGEARELARAAGLRVLAARGSELEREFSYGVVRQLFEPVLAAASPDDRAELLTGAAGLVSPLFDESRLAEAIGWSDTSFAWLHGLYWLTANLAVSTPLLLAVDDLHWADAPSLRWLAYLVRRLEGLPVAVVATLRLVPPEGDDSMLAELLADPAAVLVRPAALSERAVGELVRSALAQEADDEFCRACREATGGNPLFLRELLATLAAEGVEPAAAQAARVRVVGPEAVSRAVAARLARLPRETISLARAVAVLGDDVPVSHAASLAGIGVDATSRAMTTLAHADLLRPSAPLSYVNPVIRDAVYAGLDPGEAALAHARAARILADAGASPEQVAAHVLKTPPAGDAWAVGVLREAARRSRAEGSADIAVSYLRRALEEPPAEDELTDVLYELGSAERLVHGPTGIDRLSQALERMREPERRARTALELGGALFFADRAGEAVEVLDRALAEVPADETDLARRIEAALLTASLWDPRLVERTAERIDEARARAFDPGRGSRMLLAVIAYADARSGGARQEAVDLARRALAGGQLLGEQEAADFALPGMVLAAADEFDEAVRLWDDVLALAQGTGSVFAFATASCFRAKALELKGDLGEAEADARNAVEAALVHDLRGGLPWAVAFLADTLLDRGDLDEAEEALRRLEVDELPPRGPFYWFLASRGRLRLVRGDAAGGVADLLEAGRRFEELGGRNPALVPWRSQAALGLHELARVEEARALAREELRLARAWGAPRALGHALRVSGLVEGESRGLPLLSEAVGVLADSPARLERARALVELGAALRSAKSRTEARGPLEQGLRLAHEAGAVWLEERARTELQATGARPRRPDVRGAEALTPSERRVAAMAAEGLTNRDIAQRLFVTPKTVEVHLSSTYRKLGIRSRTELGAALVQEDTEPKAKPSPAPVEAPREGWWRRSAIPRAGAGAGEAALRRYLSGGTATAPTAEQPELPSGAVTFLFTDIEASTRLLQEVGGETYRDVLAAHHELLRSAVADHGGHVVNIQGDAFFVVFPRAGAAVRAAVQVQQALEAGSWPMGRPLRVRMGVHTGEQAPTEGTYVGLDVHRGARICSAGHGGQVLLSEETRRLAADDLPEGVGVRDLGLRRLKDLTQAQHLHQLCVPGLPTEFPPLNSLDAHETNLPIQPTPVVGRAEEIATVCRLLTEGGARLVTLTGPGGAGKTRLALQVGAQLLDAFGDGVFFVPLAAIAEPELVLPTIAKTLGLRESPGQHVRDLLLAYLRERRLLLVLDNFEQVVAAAPAVGELVAAAPELRVLVTSRFLLRLLPERELRVPPLRHDAAVELFVERAQAADPRFRLTEENAALVSEICERLEGLPLALELAAARTRLLPPAALLARLGRRLDVLTGGLHDLPSRHRTLRAAIEWSHELLDEGEQRLLARLAVFVGGWTVEAAEAVCTPGADVLDGLASLEEKSLLRQDDRSDEPRFLMLETIREFALEWLASGPDLEDARLEHARHYLELAERAGPELTRAEQARWLERLDLELDNLRAALAWSLEQETPELGLRLAFVLVRFWEARGHLAELEAWLDEALERAEAAPPLARARGLRQAARIRLHRSDYDGAQALYEPALELFREVDDREGLVYALSEWGWVAAMRGDFERARELGEEGLEVARGLDDPQLLSLALNNLAATTSEAADHARATVLFEESLALRRQLGDARGTVVALTNLGLSRLRDGDSSGSQTTLEEAVASAEELGDTQLRAFATGMLAWALVHTGDLDRATDLFCETLALRRETGERRFTADALQGLASVAAARGQPERAARLWGAAEALLRSIDASLSPADRAVQEPFLERARAALPQEAWDEAWQAGRELDLDGAVAFAFEQAAAAA